MGEDSLKKQQTRYFVLTFISFAAIFILLGILVFHFVQTSMYSQVDTNLTKFYSNEKILADTISRTQSIDNTMNSGELTSPKIDSKSSDDKEKVDNFQEQIILWSSDGEILNSNSLGIRMYDFVNLSLDTSKLNEITNLSLSDADDQTLGFRSIVVENNTDEEDYSDQATSETTTSESAEAASQVAYVQILTNTDQITQSVHSFRKILIICMLVFAAFSILLSYYLSGRFIQPIIASWRKQQQFVENASHELRTPLTIIQAKLEGLFTKPERTILEESEDIALSLNEVQRLSRLTNDLLMLARSDSDAVLAVKQPTKVNDFLNKTLEPYGEILAAEDKEFSLVLGENRQILIDPEKIQQLLLILIDNAMKYTIAGESVTVVSTFRSNDWLLEVKDTGSGISDEAKAHIFDRFYRADASRNRDTGGYGIGLSIAMWIVKLHGGKISVLDNQPRGTVFQLQLPLK
ncbi:sensor histidine kinase [Enterococcus sp. HY326]|uniref:sensor histidine kinase n=1 Tax=Enterococcus sp. HY326 TaxID=2971265 RepID=UPI0022401585|nr:HAMP domain-containing sensor histidine kinase [Enterococcus sp. HY326]